MRSISTESKFLSAAFAVAIILLPARTVLADTLDYTFTGVGSGTISGNTNTNFDNAEFTISFTENTADIYSPDTGYYAYDGISGTFTEGSYSTTLTNTRLEVNGNGDTGMGSFETVFLFNTNDFGTSLGISSNAALLGYNLATPVTTGVVTGADAGAFFDTLGFSTTTGDTVNISSLSSLDFTASAPLSSVPEPSTLALLLVGFAGIGFFRRRLSS